MPRTIAFLFCRSAMVSGFLLLTTCVALRAQTDASGPGNQVFDVCDGTYALCTTAKCSSSYSCTCDVIYKPGQPNYSVGSHQKGEKACVGVNPREEEPAVGRQIRSRYYPIKGYATCTNDRPWAMCLNDKCTVFSEQQNGKQVFKAKCDCTAPPKESPTTPYVYVTDSAPPATACTTGTISSATISDVNAITLFLNSSTQLHPTLPFKVWPAAPK
jgi:hypothetical protein